MKKTVGKVRQPLADKVLKRIQKELKKDVIDLSAVREGRRHAQDLQQTITNSLELEGLPPSFAAYAWTQNQLSVMVEQLLCLTELRRFNEILERSEELYTPSGPPMSPLTPSFHSCWSTFDIGVGLGKETLGSIAIAVHQRFGAHESFLKLARQLAESRNGVYRIIGVHNGLIAMKELWTGLAITARNASGYDGEAGELWFTRVLPPNDMEPGVHVVFNTPYNLHQTSAESWLQYFDRVLLNSKPERRVRDFNVHMKFGDEPFYWSEYIFYSYYNHTDSFIWAKGVPDIVESLPHKDEYQASRVW